jgi:SPP1 gp7 family putative phage head morphogenesis protein
MLEDAMGLVRRLLVPKLEEIAATQSKVAYTDAAHDELGEIIDEISQQFFEKWSRRRFGDVVRPVGEEVARFNAAQLNKQLSAAIAENISVDVVGVESWLASAIEEFTRENVALIRTIPEQFFSDLEKSIAREVADGARWEQLAALVEERYSVSESRAELIARDQVGKFNGDLSRVRQGELGIKKFVWRTMGDERVREEHQDRNGHVYEWSDPPDGETPGEPIQCRCFAEPDVQSALGD